MERWPHLAGEVRGLLRNAEHDVPDGDVARIEEAMNEVAAKMALSREALGHDGATVREGTTQLRATLDNLLERAAELRITIEQGGQSNAE